MKMDSSSGGEKTVGFRFADDLAVGATKDQLIGQVSAEKVERFLVACLLHLPDPLVQCDKVLEIDWWAFRKCCRARRVREIVRDVIIDNLKVEGVFTWGTPADCPFLSHFDINSFARRRRRLPPTALPAHKQLQVHSIIGVADHFNTSNRVLLIKEEMRNAVVPPLKCGEISNVSSGK